MHAVKLRNKPATHVTQCNNTVNNTDVIISIWDWHGYHHRWEGEHVTCGQIIETRLMLQRKKT